MFIKNLFGEKRCLACSTPFYRRDGFSLLSNPPFFFKGLESLWEESLQPALDSALFCPACVGKLWRRVRGYCPHCGDIFAWPLLPLHSCDECLQKEAEWDSFIFHNSFEGLLRQMILQLKFGNSLISGYALGSLLAMHPDLKALDFDMLLPVPLHKKRLLQRGYNQAMELCRGVRTALKRKIELRSDYLQRVRNNPPQVGLAHKERYLNVKNIFKARENKLKGRKILLVDDVYTTGSTLKEAARVLKDAGAKEIHVLVAARASRFLYPDQS